MKGIAPYRATCLVTAALLFAAVPAAAEHHEVEAPEWDQAKVTEHAARLAEAAESLLREIQRQTTQSQIGSGQANAMLQFRDNLRSARNESRRLSRQLSDGGTREDTSASYRRLMTLVRDARETARRLMVLAPATDHVEAANAALDALAPFYPDIRPS
jgi:hypothetical protein